MMNRVCVAASFIPRTSLKRISTTEIRRGKADLSKIKKIQLEYQANEDVPVYIKGGTKDYVIFFTSLALLSASLVGAANSLYRLSKK